MNKQSITLQERLYSLTPNERANESFASSVVKRTNGQSKEKVSEFLWIMEQVTAAREFTYSNVQSRAKAFDIEQSELASLFKVWCETMLRFDKIATVQSVYDETVWITVR
jgi:hypothetical protein